MIIQIYLKEMMGRIADDTLAYYKMLEERTPDPSTTTFEGVGQGTWSFTTELPAGMSGKTPVQTKDVWGFYGFPGNCGDFS